MSPSSSSLSASTVVVSADETRKLLRIRYRGTVTAEHTRASIATVREHVLRMGPGFTLLTDLSELQEMEIDTVQDITSVMDLCLSAGVKRVLRVIPEPAKDIGFKLLSLTHYRGRVPTAVYASLAEAEQAIVDG